MDSNGPKQMCCDPCAKYLSYLKCIEGNGVYASDIPFRVSEEELYHEFSRYGQIADFYFADSKTYCLVNYEERRAADDVLMYPVRIFGREVRIRPRFTSPADEEKRAALSHVPEQHDEIWKSIPQDRDFKDQVAEFLKAVQPDDDSSRKPYEVCKDIENALKHLSVTYKIIPFGSSINGLALKDSDLDIFYGREPQCRGAEVLDVFRKVKNVLEKVKIIESMRPIPNARVPIIKFIHTATGLNCDLSFKNAMGVQNSKLLRFIGSLDERIKQFFIIVKYWAKLHHLTGRRLSNYALTLLIINFLQSLNEPILPPLHELQHAGVAPINIGDWNTNFDDSITRLRPISNDLPIEELLSRFFESVVQTDFANYVVSPYLGSLIHRDVFHQMVKLPKELKNYIYHLNVGRSRLSIQSPLCIQDPFELNLNVTKNVPIHDFKCLREHCAVASRLSFTSPPHLFLSKLLSTSYKYPSRNENTKGWLPNPMHVRPLKGYMTFHVPRPDNVTDEIIWMNNVTQRITLIFKKILKIHVDNSTLKNDTKPGGDQNLECKGSQVLWLERNKLWGKWHSKLSAVSDSSGSGGSGGIEVVLVSDETQSTSLEIQPEKRKREEEESTESNKRVKLSSDENQQGSTHDDLDVIDLGSEDTVVTKEAALFSRSLHDEISLTNEMVKKGHALPASHVILDFTCKICRSSSNIRIEISDHRSRVNYFPSLCLFLEDFLGKHITEAENP